MISSNVLPSENTLFANVVDVRARTIQACEVRWHAGKIVSIQPTNRTCHTYLLPGFVDAHIHIESSMLTPAEFASVAVTHGTVATVSDPHEIANVLGADGIEFLLNSSATVPLKVMFGAPSCVPATAFETAGSELDAAAVAQLLADPRIGYLSEVMNYPGVLSADEEVLAKIAAAQKLQKPVDGHAPGLRGEDARQYVAAGISTDHECTTREEALDKLDAGCKIQIREGSAARNYEALHSLIDEYPHECMFCSDDKHPDDLLEGHINLLVRDAVGRGMDVFNVLQCACINPVEHYGLNVGTLRVDDPADMIEVNDLTEFKVLRTFIDGQLVSSKGVPSFITTESDIVNRMSISPKQPTDFAVEAKGERIRVIVPTDGELVTTAEEAAANCEGGFALSDPDRDILKIVVVNRYADEPPTVAFVKNFGLQRGAIASSVAHDCHNIVAVGVSDDDLCRAVNLVIENKGGLSVAAEELEEVLPLPIAGLMSDLDCETVGAKYRRLNSLAAGLGSTLQAPFMTLSFMALLVIPSLKLSDRGLFDGDRFEFVSVFV